MVARAAARVVATAAARVVARARAARAAAVGARLVGCEGKAARLSRRVTGE